MSKKEKTTKPKTKSDENIFVINGEFLSGYNDALLEDLAKFLKEKIKGKVKRDANDVLINSTDKTMSKTKIRTYTKKFLYKNKIDNSFKIISLSGKGNTLVLHKQKEILS